MLIFIEKLTIFYNKYKIVDIIKKEKLGGIKYEENSYGVVRR